LGKPKKKKKRSRLPDAAVMADCAVNYFYCIKWLGKPKKKKKRSRLPDAAVMADCAGTSTRGWRQH